MNPAASNFRVHYDQAMATLKWSMIEQMKLVVSQEIDAKANSLFGLFQQQLNTRPGLSYSVNMNAHVHNPVMPTTMPPVLWQPTSVLNPSLVNFGNNSLYFLPKLGTSPFVTQLVSNQAPIYQRPPQLIPTVVPLQPAGQVHEQQVTEQQVSEQPCQSPDTIDLDNSTISDAQHSTPVQSPNRTQFPTEQETDCEVSPIMELKSECLESAEDNLNTETGSDHHDPFEFQDDENQVENMTPSNIAEIERQPEASVIIKTNDHATMQVGEKMYKTVFLYCPFNGCCLQFGTRSERDQHMRQKHGILPRQCLLPNCGKSFNTKDKLKEHIGAVHSKIESWKCGQCEKQLHGHSSAYEHYYYNHFQGSFRCLGSNCNFVGNTRKHVINHYRIKHKPRGDNVLVEMNQPIAEPQVAATAALNPGSTRRFPERQRSTRAVSTRDFRPFQCKWIGCSWRGTKVRSYAVQHIRTAHFKLPITLKEQRRLNIFDPRNPNDYIKVLCPCK